MTTFYITMSPQRRDDQLAIVKSGDTLILNGDVVDPMHFDANMAGAAWIVEGPERVDDGWWLSIILPHGPAAPEETRYPESISVSVDGPIELPPYGPRAQNRIPEGVANTFLPPAPRRIRKQDEQPNLRSFYMDPSALDAIPDTRLAISDCIAYWAQTDTLLRQFLSTRFGPDQNAVNDLLEKHAKKDDALGPLLRIASGLASDSAVKDACTEFLSRRGSMHSVRNAFAHGTWLLSSDYLGSILLMQSKDARRVMNDLAKSDIFNFNGIQATFDLWTAEDFRRARTSAVALRNEAIQLIGLFPPVQQASD